MFARFVMPILPTILCALEIWSGSNNRVYMLTRTTQKNITKKKEKTVHRIDFEADLWPETGDYSLTSYKI